MAQHDEPGRAREDLLAAETRVEQATGMPGPANWWRMGLIAVGVLAALLLIMQIIGGGARTDVVPGTPVVQENGL